MSQRPRLLCIVPWLSDEVKRLLEEAAEVDYRPRDREVLAGIVHEYDAIWIHFDMKIDAEILARATRLKVINTATTGTDHIDKAEAARRGIRVLSTARDQGLLNTFTATAELGWMLLLACARQLRGANRAATAGDWGNSERFQGDQLSGRTLGVLGMGRLGKMTAGFGLGFRMRVLGCDPRPFNVPGVERVEFDELLRASDALAIHIHMTPENLRLFDAGVFARIKPGCILINTSRGDILDEQALLAALESGRLAGFGADVLHDEWRPDMGLQPIVRYAQTHDNVVLTPHIGGATRQTIEGARLFSARKLAHYLRTGEELTMP